MSTCPSKSKRDLYRITKWKRADVPCEHQGLDYREALDLQHMLTKKEGSQNPEFIYTIEENS